MQHKQNAVIQRCVVGLAGVFSVIGLALFWRNDVAEAQGSDGQDSNQVWGVDNRVEYLSTLTFLVSGNNTLEGGVWKAYSGATSTRGAILATGEVRVGSSNTMASAAKYAFIWWGTGNTANAIGVTIVGGARNRSISPNATILGGISNFIGATNGFVWGGSGNEITKTNALIMGGENNWNDGTNSVILGMKNNILARGENNAIVGTNVRINSDTDNVFVRSDNPTSEFWVQASNTFYINTQKGVWVNTNAPAVKFDSRGAVQVGQVWNWNLVCNSSKIGQIGTISSGSVSCLCACSSCGGWESMVDDEEGSCRAICNSGNGGGVNTCVDCSAYTLASCPANGICSVCVSWRYKLDNCVSGYTKSGNFCYPTNCSQGNMVINSHNYHYPDLTHGNTGPANVTITGTPANGKTVCVQTFRCTNGNVTTQWSESCTITCNSEYTLNGSSCVASATPVNGVCGSANGSSITSKPTTNLCSAGTASTVAGSWPWTWTCAGSNAGSTASCSASVSQRKNVDINCDQNDKSFTYNGTSYTVAGCNSTINATYTVGYTTKDNSSIQDLTVWWNYSAYLDGIYGGMYDSTDINKACPTGWHVPTKSEIDAWVKSFSINILNQRYPGSYSNLASATDVVKFAQTYNIPLNGGFAGTWYPFPHGRGNYATLLYVKDSSNSYYPRLDLQKSMGWDDPAWLNYQQGWNSSRWAIRCFKG